MNRSTKLKVHKCFFLGREPTLNQLMQLVLGLVGMHFEKGAKKVKTIQSKSLCLR